MTATHDIRDDFYADLTPSYGAGFCVHYITPNGNRRQYNLWPLTWEGAVHTVGIVADLGGTCPIVSKVESTSSAPSLEV